MRTANTTVVIGKKSYSAELGTITGTSLGYNDRGLLTASITCDLGGGGGIAPTGGYCLDEPVRGENDEFLGREPHVAGLVYITEILKVAGAETWEGLIGKRIWVLFPGESKSFLGMEADGIAAVDSEKSLVLKEFWKEHLS